MGGIRLKKPVHPWIALLVVALFGLFLTPAASPGAEKEGNKEKAGSADPLRALEERTIEVLQLKSDIILLQSEIIRLQSEIIRLKEKNAQLERALSDKQKELRLKDRQISRLKRRISLLQKGKGASNPRARDEFVIRYEKALGEYQSGNYRRALKQFAQLLATNSHHYLSDNCQYWIGECYYGLKQYEQAIEAFRKVFTYRKSNKRDDAQMKLWLCYLRLGDKDKAQEELQKLFTDYPNSEYVAKAKELLKLFGEKADTTKAS